MENRELLRVLHLYKPLEFILFNGILSRSWLYMVLYILSQNMMLLVRTAIFKLVFRNKLVTLCTSGL